jgi:hypothetical protein
MASDQAYILVYTREASQRLRYVLDVFFSYVVKANIQLTSSAECFRTYPGPKFSYDDPLNAPQNTLFIPRSGLLVDNSHFADFVVKLLLDKTHKQLKKKKVGQLTYDFDLLAICFYLLTQYELYSETTPRDHLGRLSGWDSHLYKANLLHRPIVDELCLQVVQSIQLQWPQFPIVFPRYQYRPTYDIDISWAFGHRGLLRQTGALLRDLAKADLPKIHQRWRVFRGLEPDPFDTFALLDQLHERYSLQPIYFFLLGDYGGLDRNIHPGHRAQQQLFHRLAQRYQTGLHPSIRSGGSMAQLSKEAQRYTDITGQTLRDSRQHYLALDLPTTYRKLLQIGIQKEYSLGFAEVPGFRAGIARPFPWYDLEKETSTDLILHPFVIMDQALRRVVDKDHSSLTEKILSFARTAKAVNGQVYTLWHNSSFSALEGWQGWAVHYEALIKQFI